LIKDAIKGFYKVILLKSPRDVVKKVVISFEDDNLEFLIHKILDFLIIKFDKGLAYIPKKVVVEREGEKYVAKIYSIIFKICAFGSFE
jgi:hypothetical protein